MCLSGYLNYNKNIFWIECTWLYLNSIADFDKSWRSLPELASRLSLKVYKGSPGPSSSKQTGTVCVCEWDVLTYSIFITSERNWGILCTSVSASTWTAETVVGTVGAKVGGVIFTPVLIQRTGETGGLGMSLSVYWDSAETTKHIRFIYFCLNETSIRPFFKFRRVEH